MYTTGDSPREYRAPTSNSHSSPVRRSAKVCPMLIAKGNAGVEAPISIRTYPRHLMRLHRRTRGPRVYHRRYYRYARRVITALHSIVHGIRRVRSTGTMIPVVPSFFLPLPAPRRSCPWLPFFAREAPRKLRGQSCSPSLDTAWKIIIDGRRSFSEITVRGSVRFPSVLLLFYCAVLYESTPRPTPKPRPYR